MRPSAFSTMSMTATPLRYGSTPSAVQPRTGARRFSPCVLAKSSRATTIAPAASLTPPELPAVIEKPSISGWIGRGVASRILVHCKHELAAVSGAGGDGHDLVSEVTCVDGGYRPPVGSAHASISSRRSPAICAVFQPTGIDMSRFGASARSGCVGGTNDVATSPVAGSRQLRMGAVEVD